jgi:hypothetical protein
MKIIRNMGTSILVCLGMILSLSIGMASVGSAVAAFINLKEEQIIACEVLTLIRLCGICKIYGEGEARVDALKDIDL